MRTDLGILRRKGFKMNKLKGIILASSASLLLSGCVGMMGVNTTVRDPPRVPERKVRSLSLNELMAEAKRVDKIDAVAAECRQAAFEDRWKDRFFGGETIGSIMKAIREANYQGCTSGLPRTPSSKRQEMWKRFQGIHYASALDGVRNFLGTHPRLAKPTEPERVSLFEALKAYEETHGRKDFVHEIETEKVKIKLSKRGFLVYRYLGYGSGIFTPGFAAGAHMEIRLKSQPDYFLASEFTEHGRVGLVTVNYKKAYEMRLAVGSHCPSRLDIYEEGLYLAQYVESPPTKRNTCIRAVSNPEETAQLKEFIEQGLTLFHRKMPGTLTGLYRTKTPD